MVYDKFECQARVLFCGKELHFCKIVTQMSLETVAPYRHPFANPGDYIQAEQRAERRRRFVDMIAAEFAQALTEALYKTDEVGK